MLSKLFSAATFGVESFLVDVEVDIRPGLPLFNIVGLPDTAVQESKERVRSAIRNSEYEFPRRRITVNLAPADIKKEGPIFDLPIALGILAASGQINNNLMRDIIVLGELSLDGTVKAINGVLPITIMAKEQRKKQIIVPKENANEAGVIKDITVFPISSLNEVIGFLNGNFSIEPTDIDIKYWLNSLVFTKPAKGRYP